MEQTKTWLKSRWITAVRRDAGLLKPARKAASALYQFMSSDGSCFPNLDTLAEAQGCSVRQIQRGTTALVAAGYLTKYQPGRANSNRYYVRFPEPGKDIAPPAVEPAASPSPDALLLCPQCKQAYSPGPAQMQRYLDFDQEFSQQGQYYVLLDASSYDICQACKPSK